MLCCNIIWFYVLSRLHSALILCPNVAWSRVGLHLECVGPSIIPLSKYLHKETGLLPLAKTRESSVGTLFFKAIYRYEQREGQARSRRGKRDTERHQKKEKKIEENENKKWQHYITRRKGSVGGMEGKKKGLHAQNRRSQDQSMNLCELTLTHADVT